MRETGRERPSPFVLLLVPGAIVVAGTLLVLRLHFQPPTVPTFSVSGTGDETPLSSGGSFVLEIRPDASITGAVGARAFLVRGDQVRPWDPPFTVSRDGSVRIAGAVDALFMGVPGGTWEVAVAVGRPETLPVAPQDILRRRDATSDTATAAWRLVRRRIRLER